MKRICYINDLPPNSGVGRYALTVKRLLEKEYAIDYYSLDYPTRSLVLLEGSGERAVASTWAIPLADNKPWFWFRLRNRLPTGYDLYHFVNPNISFMVGRQTSVVTCEDLAVFHVQDFWAEKLWRRLLYSGLRRADAVIAISEWSKRDLVELYHLPPERVAVTLLGVDAGVFRPLDRAKCRQALGLPGEGRYVLSVATEKKRKNLDGLLRAFAVVSRTMPDARLLRVGSPTRRTAELIGKLGLAGMVRYFEGIGEAGLVQLYNAADVLAFPSFYEGFGLPVLEAMACGCPVVSSNASSLPEVAGQAAILVDPRDDGTLARSIIDVLQDRALSARLAAMGRERAAGFGWERTARDTAEVYRKVLGT